MGCSHALESSFQSQRQFVANASHELRTPLTVERALLEVALADPDGDYGSLRAACERVLASSEEQERLIEALLTLASSERGLERREPLDLGALTNEALGARRAEIERRGLSLSATIVSAPSLGDPRLIGRLVANLLDNALRHNVAGGHVEVMTDTRAGHAVLSVSNSGPAVLPRRSSACSNPSGGSPPIAPVTARDTASGSRSCVRSPPHTGRALQPARARRVGSRSR